MFTVLLYTHNTLSPAFWQTTTMQLAKAVDRSRLDGSEQPQVIVLANAPLPVPPGWELDTKAKGERGLIDCWDKIHRGCQMARYDRVYTCEHDVLYPATYFERCPQLGATPGYWYNRHLWCLDERGFYRSHASWGRLVTSNMVAPRKLLLDTARDRVEFLRNGGRLKYDEPGMMNRKNGYPYDEPPMKAYMTREPVVDVRLPGCLTGQRNAYDQTYVPTLSPWGAAADLLAKVMT